MYLFAVSFSRTSYSEIIINISHIDCFESFLTYFSSSLAFTLKSSIYSKVGGEQVREREREKCVCENDKKSVSCQKPNFFFPQLLKIYILRYYCNCLVTCLSVALRLSFTSIFPSTVSQPFAKLLLCSHCLKSKFFDTNTHILCIYIHFSSANYFITLCTLIYINEILLSTFLHTAYNKGKHIKLIVLKVLQNAYLSCNLIFATLFNQSW